MTLFFSNHKTYNNNLMPFFFRLVYGPVVYHAKIEEYYTGIWQNYEMKIENLDAFKENHEKIMELL